MAARFLQMLRTVLTGGLVSFQAFSAGIGYFNGGAVTQLTNKSTGVTLNQWCGQITMNNAQLNATTSVAFTLTNGMIVTSAYQVNVWIVSGATAGSYFVNIDSMAAGSCSINVRNYSAGNLSEALVLGFSVEPRANA